MRATKAAPRGGGGFDLTRACKRARAQRRSGVLMDSSDATRLGDFPHVRSPLRMLHTMLWCHGYRVKTVNRDTAVTVRSLCFVQMCPFAAGSSAHRRAVMDHSRLRSCPTGSGCLGALVLSPLCVTPCPVCLECVISFIIPPTLPGWATGP